MYSSFLGFLCQGLLQEVYHAWFGLVCVCVPYQIVSEEVREVYGLGFLKTDIQIVLGVDTLRTPRHLERLNQRRVGATDALIELDALAFLESRGQ